MASRVEPGKRSPAAKPAERPKTLSRVQSSILTQSLSGTRGSSSPTLSGRISRRGANPLPGEEKTVQITGGSKPPLPRSKSTPGSPRKPATPAPTTPKPTLPRSGSYSRATAVSASRQPQKPVNPSGPPDTPRGVPTLQGGQRKSSSSSSPPPAVPSLKGPVVSPVVSLQPLPLRREESVSPPPPEEFDIGKLMKEVDISGQSRLPPPIPGFFPPAALEASVPLTSDSLSVNRTLSPRVPPIKNFPSAPPEIPPSSSAPSPSPSPSSTSSSSPKVRPQSDSCLANSSGRRKKSAARISFSADTKSTVTAPPEAVKAAEPIATPRSTLNRITTSPVVKSMVMEAIEAGKSNKSLPVEPYLDEPVILDDEPIPTVLNLEDLNKLFPTKTKTQGPPESFIAYPNSPYSLRIYLNSLHASPQEIEKARLETEKVQELHLYQSNIRNEQLAALLYRLPHLTHLTLCLNPHLTDEGLLAVCKLRQLKYLAIQDCHGVTTEGIELLSSLPMSHLQEVRVTTSASIQNSKFIAALTDAPLLQSADFTLCESLDPRELLRLRKNGLRLRIGGCTQVNSETIAQLTAAGTKVESGGIDKGARLKSYGVQAEDPIPPGEPPEFPKSEALLSTENFKEFFLGDKPTSDVIRAAFSDPKTISKLKKIRHLSLSGIQNEQLEALRDCFCEAKIPIESIRLFNCPELTNLYLRGLNLRRLLIGKCSIPAKELELALAPIPFFPDPNNPKRVEYTPPLPELEELHLAGMPISTQTLKLTSALPRLTRLNLSNCKEVSSDSFQYLKGAKNLEELDIRGCTRLSSSTVEKYIAEHPKVTVKASPYLLDSFLRSLALDDAQWQIESPQFVRLLECPIMAHYKGPPLSPEEGQARITEKEQEEVTNFYKKELEKYGFDVKRDLRVETMGRKEWLKADLILQACENNQVIGYRILDHLVGQVGYFTNQDYVHPPQTIEELINCLKLPPRPDLKLSEIAPGEQKSPHETPLPLPNEKQIQREDDKKRLQVTELQVTLKRSAFSPAIGVRELDFSGVTFIPHFVREINWPRVTVVRLDRKYMQKVPPGFLPNLPAFTGKNINPQKYLSEDGTQLVLAGFPITDETLLELGKLRLQKPTHVDLSLCDRISWKGLKELLNNKNIMSINLKGCKNISPFDTVAFSTVRPQVQIQEPAEKISPIYVQFANEQSQRELKRPKRYFRLILPVIAETKELASDQLLKNPNPAKKEIINNFYRNILGKLGLESRLNNMVWPISPDHWEKIETFLMALRDVMRIASALPAKTEEATTLDLSNLGLSSIHYLSQYNWANLEELKLQGNFFDHLEPAQVLPPTLRQHFPNLKKVDFSDKRFKEYPSPRPVLSPSSSSSDLEAPSAAPPSAPPSASPPEKGGNWLQRFLKKG